MNSQEILQSCMHVTLTTRPWGVHGGKIKQLLEQTILWNGQHGHNNKEIPGESETFKQVVHTQVQNNRNTNKECLLT
jgi:hypothetical protein